MLHGLVISAAPGDGNRQSVDGVAAPAVVASPHEAAATAATAAATDATDADGSPLRVRTIADIADSVGQSHDKNQSLAASSCSRCSLPRSPSIYPSAARFYFCFPPVTRLCSRFLSLSLSRARARGGGSSVRSSVRYLSEPKSRRAFYPHAIPVYLHCDMSAMLFLMSFRESLAKL